MPHTASNWSAWLSSKKEASFKDDAQESLQTVCWRQADYWNHVLWSDETKINLFGSDGVKRVWWQPDEKYKDKCVLPTVKHGGGSVMVWDCMSAANMYCDILKQSIIPSL